MFIILISCVFFATVVSKVGFLALIDIRTAEVSLIGAVIGAMLPVYLLVKRWRWSIFRILDIFAVAFYLPLFYLSLYQTLVFKDQKGIFACVAWFIAFVITYKVRASKIKSGYAFTLFTIFAAVIAFFFVSNFSSLLFLISLVTIGLVIFYLRNKRDMANTNLPADFVNNLKRRLIAKDKSLTKQDNLLTAEDAYMAQGRATDNADPLDEAALEDNQKEITDIRKDAIKNMQLGVKKALAMIKIGKYGLCEVCGKPIDKARLEAFPEATTCVEHMR